MCWRGHVPLVLWLIGASLSVRAAETSASQPTPPASPPPVPSVAGASEPDVRPVEAYTYDAEGRRDPFVSLLGSRADVGSLSERPPGLRGLSINEISLRGLVRAGGEYLAVMEAPDSKTYILRGDEQLFDGVVKTVSEIGVTFLQEVSDPLSLVTEREVVRVLGGREDGR